MNNTETKKVRIVPKQPRFISDILDLPERIDEEIELELNIREIIRCMQYADIYEEDKLLTPFDIGGEQLIPSTGSTDDGSGDGNTGSEGDGSDNTGGGDSGNNGGTGDNTGSAGGSGANEGDDVWNNLEELIPDGNTEG